MSFDIEHLYKLLPAYHRERDTKQESLKAILSLFAEQIAMLEDNLEQLYDDQFIETCAEWVVPYIGNLIGTKGTLEYTNLPFSQRAQVSNTIAYRRRKGTAAVVEQLAKDVTGWPANVVEYFQLLTTTQYMNHIRLRNLATINLKSGNDLEYLNTAFDNISRTVDVRNIRKKRGKYNLPNLGIFLWRQSSFSLNNSPAFKLDSRRYKFDILGNDTPLYYLPVPENDISNMATPDNIPHRISRRSLYDDFEKYYGKAKSILIHRDEAELLPSAASKLADMFIVCDLSDKKNKVGKVIGWNHMPKKKIAIDPLLGRIAFPYPAQLPKKVNVTYYYGAMAEIGGGEYGRQDSFQINSGKIVKVPDDQITLQEAINSLISTGGVVEIQNNACYSENLVVDIPEGITIELRAADKKRPVLLMSENTLIIGGENAEFNIDGLLIMGGALKVPEKNGSESNKLSRLLIQHSTIRKESDTVLQSPQLLGEQPVVIIECPDTSLVITKSVCGSIHSADSVKLQISNSIVDAGSKTNIAITGADEGDPSGSLIIENSTIIGKVHAIAMKLVTNTIIMAGISDPDDWTAAVIADRIQEGCVRFSYIPAGSKIPGPYRCIPSKQAETSNILPVFESLQFGTQGYCQLSTRCPSSITEGADDNSEMGVFHDLYQAQRIRNLYCRLDEYLRFGLEAGIFLV